MGVVTKAAHAFFHGGAVKLNKIGRGKNSNFITRAIRAALSPLRKRLTKIANYLRPGKISVKHIFGVWKRRKMRWLRHFRMNILRHPWRYTKGLAKGLLIKGALAIAAPMIIKKLMGGGGKDMENESGDPSMDPNMSQNFGGDGGGAAAAGMGAAEAAIRASQKSARDVKKKDLEARMAEVRAQQTADEVVQKGKLGPLNSNLPDHLEKIYAKSEDATEQNKTIIELLNRANEIALDNNKVGKKSLELEKGEVEARLRKSSDLYQVLQRMKSQSESANADYNDLKDQIRASEQRVMKNSDEIGKGMRNKFKAIKGKGPGLMTMLLLGFIGHTLMNAFHLFEDIRDRISMGFEKAGDYLRGVGQSLGIINDNISTTVEMKGGENDENLSKDKVDPNDKDTYPQSRGGKDMPLTTTGNGTTIPLDSEGKSKVGRTEEYYRDPETGEIDEERARKDNVFVTHKSQKNSLMTDAAVTSIPLLSTVYKTATGKLGKEAAEKAAKEAAEKAAETAAAKEGAKKVGFFGRLLNRAKDSLVGKLFGRFSKFVADKSWVGITKIIGTRNSGILKDLIKKIGGLAGKAVKGGAKKLPGLGLVFGIGEAIYRGFKEGDWVGALLSFMSGLATTIPIPGVGIAVSTAIDLIQIYRDFKMDEEMTKESEEAQKILNEAEKTGKYKRDVKGNLYDEIIRKLQTGKQSDERKKNKAIIALHEVDERAKKEGWSKEMTIHKQNEVLKETGTGLRINTITGNVEGVKEYEDQVPEAEKERRKGTLGMVDSSQDMMKFNSKIDKEFQKNLEKNSAINKGEGPVPTLETPIELKNSPFRTKNDRLNPTYLTRNYGEPVKSSSFWRAQEAHKGIDFTIGPSGDFSHPFDGEVIENKDGHVKIRDKSGFTSEYHHIKSKLQVGQKVRKGDTVGNYLLPGEGLPKGMLPHIHYEVKDLTGKNVNPFRYLDGDTSLIPKGSPDESGKIHSSQYLNIQTADMGRKRGGWGDYTVDGLTYDQRVLFLVDRMSQGLGISPEVAKGIVGVWATESGLDPHVVNKRYKGPPHRQDQGIAQWQGERPGKFAAWYKRKTGQYKLPKETSIDDQADYALYDMHSEERTGFLKEIRKARTARRAAEVTFQGYENGGPGLTDPKTLSAVYVPLWGARGTYESMLAGRIGEMEKISRIYDANSGVKRGAVGLGEKFSYNTGDNANSLQNKYKSLSSAATWSNKSSGGGGNSSYATPSSNYDPSDAARVMDQAAWTSEKAYYDANPLEDLSLEGFLSRAIRSGFESMNLVGKGADIISGKSSSDSFSTSPVSNSVTPSEPAAATGSGSTSSGGDSSSGKDVAMINNTPNIRGGDNNVSNVTNIYVTNNGSKAAEMA
jgi:hypothetical protein